MEFLTKMASKTATFIGLLFAILSLTSASYVEALAAEAFDPSSTHVELRVAVRDGYYSKYADIISGQWVTDTSAVYTADKAEILKYCQKKYPDSAVANIVDSSEPLVIEQWCPVTGEECTSIAEVTYYRCLVDPFESDALMVFNVCKFFHKHDENICREPAYWKGVANEDCLNKKMAINSTGMLLPCQTDQFKGVEYTCCPPPYVRIPTPVEEEEEETDAAPERDNVATKPQVDNNLLDDPYFTETDLAGGAEKKAFVDAKSRLSVGQKSKMARVMQQWQEAQEHYEQLKNKDKEAAEKMRKEMTARFEQTIGTMEAENAEENEELREAHQVHVEVSLREKIESAYDAYESSLRSGKAQPHARKVIHCLRRYLHAVHKARQHFIGHYKHLRQTDPLKADQHKHDTLNKLTTLGMEVAKSIGLMKALPDMYADLKPKVDALLESTRDAPEDAALIQATEEEEVAEATEPPVPQPLPVENVEEVEEPQLEEPLDIQPEQVVEDDEEEVEEEILEEVTDTIAPMVAKTTPTKTKPIPTKTKPIVPTKPKIKTTTTVAQTQPEPPTPARQAEVVVEEEEMLAHETEIEVPPVPKKAQVIAVKPIDSYLDDELVGPIETEDQQPLIPIPIVAKKPSPKVQKSAAAARVEKQRLVNRQGADSIDSSVTQKRMQLHSEPMMAFGLACGVLAVATVLVIAVLIVRRKTRRTPVNSGFTEIDPNLTVEQRHIVAMQQNGYENPTYKYFDMK